MYIYILSANFLVFFLLIFLETRKNYFSPFILIISAYFLYFIFRSFLIYLNLDGLSEYFSAHNIDIEHIEQSLLLICPMLILFYIGYKIGKKNKKNKTYKVGISFELTSPNKLFNINFLMFVMWLSINLYKYSIGITHYGGSVADRYSGFEYILSLILTLFSYSFYFLMYLYFKYKIGKYKFYFAIVVKLFFGIIGGGALPLINLGLAYLLIYFWASSFDIVYKRPKISFFKLILFGLATFVLLVIIYFFKELSREFTKLGISPIDIIFNLDSSALKIVLNNLTISQLVFSLFGRFMGIDAMSNIINSIDKGYINYSFGYMFYLLIVGIIPKFIMPDKPELSMGMWYTETLWNPDNPARGYQNTALFIPGDLYLNFGWIGVLIGMFIFGILLGYLYRIFFNNKSFLFSYVFVASSFFYFIMYEYTFASWILILLRIFLLLVIYSYLMKILSKISLKSKI